MARSVRVIVYDGPPAWLAQQQEASLLKGVRRLDFGPEARIMASYWLTPADDHVERLMAAIEGECEGLGITQAQAHAILEHVFAKVPR